MDLSFGWIALVFLVIGGGLGLAGSLAKRMRIWLALGGIFVVSSIAIFAAGLQDQFSKNTGLPSPWPRTLSLFSSSSYDLYFAHFSCSTYLYFGFWLAVAGGALMFVALRGKPDRAISPPPQSSPTPVELR